MKPVRHILDDLVERRLWPVALLLIAALVAVPVVLAKPTSSVSVAPAPTTLAVPAAGGDMTPFVGKPAVQLTSLGQRSGRLDHLRATDPFVQRHVVKVAVTASGRPGGAPTDQLGAGPSLGGPLSSIGGSLPPGGSSPGPGGLTRGASTPGSSGPSSGGGAPTAPPPGSTGASAPPATPSRPAPGGPPRTVVVSSIDVRFGAAGVPARQRTVERLALLPSRAHPVLVYLGLLTDGKTASFLLASNARPQGDGHCAPNPRDCQTVHMRLGDTEFFDVSTDSGYVQQYELDLVGVHRHRTAAASAAAVRAVSASTSGARFVRAREVHDGSLRDLHYEPATGSIELVPTPVPLLPAAPAWASQLSPDTAVSAIPGLAPVPAPPAP